MKDASLRWWSWRLSTSKALNLLPSTRTGRRDRTTCSDRKEGHEIIATKDDPSPASLRKTETVWVP